MTRLWIIAVIGGLVLAILALKQVADAPARIPAGYKAKIVCSEVFVAGRKLDDVLAAEFAKSNPLFDWVGVRLDEGEKTVRASLGGFGPSRAVYRDGEGCALYHGDATIGAATIANNEASSSAAIAPQPWRTAFGEQDGLADRVDYAALHDALDDAFADEAAGHRSILVAVDGKLVAERYASGFTAATPFLSWSMAKSVLGTLVGIAADRGFVDIDAPAPVDHWRRDDRAAISWRNLLNMQSGLDFEENYEDPLSDVNRMLFASNAVGAAAASAPLAHEPGAVFYYSSGESNILAKALHEALKAEGLALRQFAHEQLLSPIGATSFTLETDASGVFVGSSYVYATARDWARLGQLYLQGGVWNGEKILSDAWLARIRKPAAASDNQYSMHFWLNKIRENEPAYIPGLPDDVYYMAGHEGQYVVIIPDKNMVLVRTGQTRGVSAITVVAPVLAELYDAVAATAHSSNAPLATTTKTP